MGFQQYFRNYAIFKYIQVFFKEFALHLQSTETQAEMVQKSEVET